MTTATDFVQGSQILHLFDDVSRIDKPAVERAVRDLLAALGQDVARAALSATPAELADAYEALLESEPVQVEAICVPDGDHDLVVSSIPFHSLCRHLFPLRGVVHIGCLPEQHMLGVSQLGQVVEHFSHRLQTPARFATQIVEWWEQQLQPCGIAALVEVVEGEHCIAGCDIPIGSPKRAAVVARGALRDDPQRRAEFFALAERDREA